VIVSVHVATGAAAGALAGSRRRALLLGPALHLAADRIPHEGIPSRRFEIRSGLASVGLLAARRGPLDPATLGALAASAPDLEHVFPSMRPRGKEPFTAAAAGTAQAWPGASGESLSLSSTDVASAAKVNP